MVKAKDVTLHTWKASNKYIIHYSVTALKTLDCTSGL